MDKLIPFDQADCEVRQFFEEFAKCLNMPVLDVWQEPIVYEYVIKTYTDSDKNRLNMIKSDPVLVEYAIAQYAERIMTNVGAIKLDPILEECAVSEFAELTMPNIEAIKLNSISNDTALGKSHRP